MSRRARCSTRPFQRISTQALTDIHAAELVMRHRMAELTSLRWHADQHTLTQALAGARSVQTVADPHISPLLPPRVVQRQPLDLFGEVRMHCSSFSVWWKHATRGVNRLSDLPGMAAWADSHAAGPLFDALSGT